MKIWDRWHKILAVGFVIALIYIIYLQGCSKKPCPKTNDFEIKDTTIVNIVNDTIWYDTTVFNYITTNVSKYYYDTVLIEKENFGNFDQDFLFKYPKIYEGIISDDTVRIHHTVKVRGFMDDIEIGYKILQPYSLIQTDIIKVEVQKIENKPFRALYIGADFESDIDSLMYFEPELTLILGKWSFSGGISLPSNPKRWKLGAKRLIFSNRR